MNENKDTSIIDPKKSKYVQIDSIPESICLYDTLIETKTHMHDMQDILEGLKTSVCEWSSKSYYILEIIIADKTTQNYYIPEEEHTKFEQQGSDITCLINKFKAYLGSLNKLANCINNIELCERIEITNDDLNK